MKLLITEPENFSQLAIELLSKYFDVVLGVKDKNDLLHKVKDIDVIVLRLGFVIDSEVLLKASKLKIIATPTTGLNHIDCVFAESKGVRVISLNGEREFLDNITPTAELAFGLMLSLFRNIPSAIQHVKGNGWSRDLFIGEELKGKTLGILGLGRLGKMMSRFALAFEMNVLFYDVDEKVSDSEVQRVELDMLLSSSDVISIHIPLNDSTEGFLCSDKISKIKKGSYLINTSRGEVLDEVALLSALEAKGIAGAALDVVCNEPDDSGQIESKLVEYSKVHKNLIITPHIGGACYDSMRATEEFITRKILETVS